MVYFLRKGKYQFQSVTWLAKITCEYLYETTIEKSLYRFSKLTFSMSFLCSIFESIFCSSDGSLRHASMSSGKLSITRTGPLLEWQCITASIALSWISNMNLRGYSDQLLLEFNPLSANPTKWSNTIKQFVSNSRRIVWVCLTILCGCCLKG